MIKKVKFFLASDVHKEEQWLCEMSQQGYHLVKFRFFTYYFEEDKSNSYIYQIDFGNPDADYNQLLSDAGWEYVSGFISKFHYFRKNSKSSGPKKLYSDKESIKASYQQMMRFYISLFILLCFSQLPLFIGWSGYLVQKIAIGICIPVILLYIYLFFALNKKIKSFLTEAK